jgi:hypothetical protein
MCTNTFQHVPSAGLLCVPTHEALSGLIMFPIQSLLLLTAFRRVCRADTWGALV